MELLYCNNQFSEKKGDTLKLVVMIFIKNLANQSLSLLSFPVLRTGLPRYYTYGVTM